jgi:hypothetical protein
MKRDTTRVRRDVFWLAEGVGACDQIIGLVTFPFFYIVQHVSLMAAGVFPFLSLHGTLLSQFSSIIGMQQREDTNDQKPTTHPTPFAPTVFRSLYHLSPTLIRLFRSSL